MKPIKLAVASAGIFLATSLSALAAPVDLSMLQLNGNAALVGSDISLTQNLNAQRGSAFTTTATAIDANTTFSASFEFMISGDGSGADGITFGIQNDAAGSNALGTNGGSIGYGGIANSFAVEFDTWNNGGTDNGSANHVGVNQNGSLASIALANAPFQLEGAASRFAWVEYDGTTLDVFLSETSAKPGTLLLSAAIDLTDIGTQGYFGFTASTGGANSNHVIKGFSLEVGSTVAPIPLPASLPLLAFGLVGLARLGRRRS